MRTLRTHAPAYRSQPINPITNSRLSVTRATAAETAEVRLKLRRIFSDWRGGFISAADACARVARVQGQPLTVAEVWQAYEATIGPAWIATSRSLWKNHLEPAFAARHPGELTETVLATWQAKSTLAPSSLRQAFVLLQAAIRRAVASGLLDRVPWGTWTPRRGPKTERPAALSLDELEAMLAAARIDDAEAWGRREYSDTSFRVATLLLAGLRNAEGAALGWDCCEIDTPTPSILVRFQAKPAWRDRSPLRPTDPPKGGKERRIPISSSLAAALRGQRSQLIMCGGYHEHGPVFPSDPSIGAWRRMPVLVSPQTIRRIARRAGLRDAERWVTHCCRHSFCTLSAQQLAADSSRSLVDLLEPSGHADVRILQRYLHRTRSPEATLPPMRAGVIAGDIGPIPILETNDGVFVQRVLAVEKPNEPIEPTYLSTEIVAAAREAIARAETTTEADVRRVAKRHYCRAYSAALRRRIPYPIAREAGRRAQAAFLAALNQQKRAAV